MGRTEVDPVDRKRLDVAGESSAGVYGTGATSADKMELDDKRRTLPIDFADPGRS